MYKATLLLLCALLGAPLAAAGPGYLGVFLAAVEAAVVREVVPGTPAYNAGVRSGDVLVAVDGVRVATRNAFVRAASGREAGEKVRLELRRDGQSLEVVVTLAARKRRGGVGDSAPEDEVTPAPRPSLEPQPQPRPAAPGYLGVRVRVLGRELVVAEVMDDSPCAAIGVREGDVLVQLGGRRLGSLRQLGAALSAAGAGRDVQLRVRRGHRMQARTVRLGAAPAASPDPQRPFWDQPPARPAARDRRTWQQLQELRRELEELRRRLDRAERRRE